MSSLDEFLDFLWEDTKGFVNLSILSKEGAWKRLFAEWPRQRTAVSQFISLQTAEGSETYVSPSLWKQKPEAGVKYSKDLFLGSHVLWAEFDGNAPSDWETTKLISQKSESDSHTSAPSVTQDLLSPGSLDLGGRDLVSAARTAPAIDPPTSPNAGHGELILTPRPSWIIQSSTPEHQHVYWKLRELLTDVDTLENLNRTLALELGADNCWDSTRVLRPPDTTNFGTSKPERQGRTYNVIVEESSDRDYRVTNFRQTNDFRPLVKESLGKIPDIREVLARREWDAEFLEAFNAEPKFKGRSDQLQLVAYYAAEAGFTDEEIYSVLADCDERWKKYTGRNDRDKRLVDHIDRARAKHPLSDATLTFDGLLGTGSKRPLESVIETVPDKTVYKLDEFLALPVHINWMIEGLLPRGGYGFIAGMNGLGKSQLGIRLAEAVVTKTRFLNSWDVAIDNAKAMFLSLEMETAELKEFYATMDSYGNFFLDARDRFLTVPVGNEIPLDSKEGLKFVEDKLSEYQPDLLVIDSLSMAMEGSFKDDTPTLKFNKIMKKLRKVYGVAIVVIHHSRKGQDKRFRYNELDDLYGSRFLSQDTSFVLMLDKPKTLAENQLAITAAKMRFKRPEGELIVIHENMNFNQGFIKGDETMPNFEKKATDDTPRSPRTQRNPKPPNGSTGNELGSG